MDKQTAAQERQSEDMSVVFPSSKIDCNGCQFRRPGSLGYKNRYCEMYPRGKPLNILFKNEKCQFKQGST